MLALLNISRFFEYLEKKLNRVLDLGSIPNGINWLRNMKSATLQHCLNDEKP